MADSRQYYFPAYCIYPSVSVYESGLCATERVQFEDDDYYYYVKAVPKKTVAVREVTVKHFGNTASMGKRIDHSRSVLSPEEEENSRKVIAKELDIDEDLLK